MSTKRLRSFSQYLGTVKVGRKVVHYIYVETNVTAQDAKASTQKCS